MERVVVHLAAGEDRDLLVEQGGQLAEDAALRLSSETQQDEVVAGEDRVDHLGDDGILVADDAGEDLLAGLQHADEVVPHLVLYGPEMHAGLGPFGLLELA